MALDRETIRDKIFLEALARARLRGRPSDKARIQRIFEQADGAAVEAMKVVEAPKKPAKKKDEK